MIVYGMLEFEPPRGRYPKDLRPLNTILRRRGMKGRGR